MAQKEWKKQRKSQLFNTVSPTEKRWEITLKCHFIVIRPQGLFLLNLCLRTIVDNASRGLFLNGSSFFTWVRMHTQILFKLSQPLGSFEVHCVSIFAGLAHSLTKELDKSLKRMECWGMFILPFKNLKRDLSLALCVDHNYSWASDFDFYLSQTICEIIGSDF